MSDSDEGPPLHEHAEVWKQDERHWRWAWYAEDRDAGAPLVSTYTFSSAEEAIEDIQQAYPHAVVRFRPGNEPGRKRRAGLRWLALGLAAAGLGAASGLRRRRRDTTED